MEKRFGVGAIAAAVITNYLVAWSTLMILEQGQDKAKPIKNSQILICSIQRAMNYFYFAVCKVSLRNHRSICYIQHGSGFCFDSLKVNKSKNRIIFDVKLFQLFNFNPFSRAHFHYPLLSSWVSELNSFKNVSLARKLSDDNQIVASSTSQSAKKALC